MSVRNYKELSTILKKIAIRLLADQDLCKLLFHTDQQPLSHPNFTTSGSKALLNDVIRVMPRVGPQETTKSKLILTIPSGTKDEDNHEVVHLPIDIFVYTPYSEWVIAGDDLRIFLIMSKVEELLDGKNIDGIGNFRSLGFEMALTTDEICAYKMEFTIDVLS